ncbi:MAG: helix-turn-helix domain-containing protein [Planctomycetota bacterium]|jgi:predicted transcriptional regulator
MAKLNDVLNKKMKNTEFREAFEEFEQGFQIAQRLATLRKKKGYTQKELAEKAHTSQSAIARLESGQHRNLTLSFLQKVSHALGLAPEIRFHKVS